MTGRAVALALLLAACGGEPPPAAPVPPPQEERDPRYARRVTWDHILVAFEGSYERVKVYRSEAEARELAYSILSRLQAGVDFGLLKREYSDDRKDGVALGPYVAVAEGVRHQGAELPRGNLYPGLAEVVFGLKRGEVGIADHDARRCPQGWHVVKVLDRQ